MPATVIETHISTIVCEEDRVLKFKKPVVNDFIDLRSRATRKRLCDAEVELNRRIAPDVYMGTVEVDGEPAVLMRRMPDDRRLSTLIASRAGVHAEIRSIAKLVASFHTRAVRSPEISRAGSSDVIGELWEENLDALTTFAPSIVDGQELSDISQWSRRYGAGRTRLFESRIAAGNICDGHGDLLAADIYCMPDGPRILDCVEFDDALRYVDVISDIAFLAMDLERLGNSQAAVQLLRDYAEFSGDTSPTSLIEHYIAYRAVVRAKVACLRHEQGDQAAAEEARLLLQMASSHIRRALPTLMLVGGAPGSGKSTLTKAISDARDWTTLSSDEVRHDVAGTPHDVHAASSFGGGIYTSVQKDLTYQTLIYRARELLEYGESVILDATWSRREWREKARLVAGETQSSIVEIECVTSGAVRSDRLRQRSSQNTASDASVEVGRELAARFEPWAEATQVSTTVEVSQAGVLLDAEITRSVLA